MPEDTVFKNKTELKTKIIKPKLYKVILHNDDYTTMEFVIEILVTVFNKPVPQANKIMLDIHKKGKGIVGVYTYDIALTKTTLTESIARERQYPLKTSIEEA
jgi:ATP-dependent Clp protease adaptor protein ClpS